MSSLNENSLIGVCGAGAMGAGIAQVAAQSGHKVIVYDRSEQALQTGHDYVTKGAAALLKRGKIDESEQKAIIKRLSWVNEVKQLSNCDLIIEAIIEDKTIKRALFADLEACTQNHTILATNTSSIPVSSLAAGLERPENFIGLHFFNPAPIMKLVEVICAHKSDPQSVEAAYQLMQSWNKKAVYAKDVPGFIVNRLARPFYGEGWRAYEEAVASAATIDFLYRDLAGFRMGPMELGDLIGHDINSKAAISIFESYHGRTRFYPSLAQDQLVLSGQLGRKSGAGVYTYDNEHVAEVSLDEPLDETCHIICGPQTDLFSHALKNKQFESSIPNGFWLVDNVYVGFSNGHSAGYMAQKLANPVAVLDWVSGVDSSHTIAYSYSCSTAQVAARKFLSAVGKQPVSIKDRPGALVFRTLLQLVNAACDALRDNVASEEAIDMALRYGVNYPFGPLSWARSYGLKKAVTALENIAEETGEHSLYQPNEVLRALTW